MNIQWLNKNDDILNSDLQDGRHLSNSILKEGENSLQRINLIFCSRNEIQDFISAMEQFSPVYNGISFHIGLINEDKESAEEFQYLETDGFNLFFGNKSMASSFRKLAKNENVLISNRCPGDIKTIGYQRHLTFKEHLLSVSLAESRNAFSKAESVIRTTDSLFFDLSAIKKQDSFSANSMITGYDIYEACQLVRYAGLSEKLNFLFFNVEDTNVNRDTWQCLSTLFWYFIEGFQNRQIDNTEVGFEKIYLVENEYFENPLEFIHSQITNRWWFKHPESEEKIPCSELDFKSFNQGNIPDLIIAHLFAHP